MTCERCDQPTFPGRGFCADHLLESLGLEHDETPEERELNRRCVAASRRRPLPGQVREPRDEALHRSPEAPRRRRRL